MRPYTQVRERTTSWRKVSLRDQISEWELTQQVGGGGGEERVTACAKALSPVGPRHSKVASMTGDFRARARMVGAGAGDMAMGFPGSLPVSLFQEHQETGKDESGQLGTETKVRSLK